MNRTEAQKIALTCIYDALLYAEAGLPLDVEEVVTGLCELPYDRCDTYVKRMFISALKHQAEIVPVYQARMTKWQFSRLNHLEQAILLLAYCQYFYGDEKTDRKIVINVAVNFAKTYLDANDYKFVNAILDKVLVQ
ncbi:MAG: transcription antitermination factor NusB [Erysipelotrichaceae bacterium]|nr:transcription antitermination factor NusB [Erysipelotrichaceae bacterium]